MKVKTRKLKQPQGAFSYTEGNTLYNIHKAGHYEFDDLRLCTIVCHVGGVYVEIDDSTDVVIHNASVIEAGNCKALELWNDIHDGDIVLSHCSAVSLQEGEPRTSVCLIGSSHVSLTDGKQTIRAYDNSLVNSFGHYGLIEAKDFSTIIVNRSYMNCKVKLAGAARKVAVAYEATGHPPSFTQPVPFTNAEEWCKVSGLKPNKSGIVTLYKQVRANFGSLHDPAFMWTPGTKPTAKMASGECTAGLHASPTCVIARAEFGSLDKGHRFIAVPVFVKDLRVFPRGGYPFRKAKFGKVAAPVYEVDVNGKRIKK